MLMRRPLHKVPVENRGKISDLIRRLGSGHRGEIAQGTSDRKRHQSHAALMGLAEAPVDRGELRRLDARDDSFDFTHGTTPSRARLSPSHLNNREPSSEFFLCVAEWPGFMKTLTTT
ncbi:hypothetical protein N7468_010786 [Penicillium chermesinum]|uniref:Uncharacterized protein n=1 Tax=Penicillium chermesinum TaxID=63820 RepID=A0A9W9N8F0_9EURO|nr:uncharacterized protein N7468_010786 [Penicillium chermesinum]KAJ5215107.1 hypothetical protein N7468_010786 [Penicillium chermesinum]KAJ6141403.1 hypothetical protein N7470_009793 [Penicillium chermesinum]